MTLCGVHSNISPFVFGDVVTDGGQIFTERDIKSNQAVVQIPTSSQLIDGSSNALIALQQHNITACIDGELLLTLYRLSNIYSDTPAFWDDLIYRHGGKQSNLIELNLHGENITYCSASEIFNSSYYPILRDTDTIHHILCVPPYRVDQYHDCIYITSSTSVHGEKLSTVVNFNLYGENIIHHPNEIFNSSCYPILRDVFNHYHDHQSIQHNTTTTGDALIGNVQLQDALTSITYRCSSNDIVFVDNVVCIIDGHQDVDCSPSSLHLTHSIDHSKTDRHHKISICSVNHRWVPSHLYFNSDSVGIVDSRINSVRQWGESCREHYHVALGDHGIYLKDDAQAGSCPCGSTLSGIALPGGDIFNLTAGVVWSLVQPDCILTSTVRRNNGNGEHSNSCLDIVPVHSENIKSRDMPRIIIRSKYVENRITTRGEDFVRMVDDVLPTITSC